MVDRMLEEIDSTIFEDDIEFRIISCESPIPGLLIIIIDLVYIYEHETIQRWEVRCEDVVEHQIFLGSHARMMLDEDHVLVMQHNEQKCDLFVSSSTDNPFEVLGKLYTVHLSLTDGWRPFGEYLNNLHLDVLRSGLGLLASGPEGIIKAYGNVLDDFQIRNSSVPIRSMANNNKELSVLIFDEAFVVARKFIARRIQ